MKMEDDDFERFLNMKLIDASFRKEWEEGKAKHQLIKAMIQANLEEESENHL